MVCQASIERPNSEFETHRRSHRFLLPEIDFEPPLRAGEQVVVTRGEHLAYGTVARSVPQLAARRAAPAVTSTSRVLRRVSTQDVTARLKQQHREREADRVCGMKIKGARAGDAAGQGRARA